jgi:hypothetical protein
MPELLKIFTPGSGASPRRGVLRALATVGAGSILGGVYAPAAEAKNKGKKRCKKCPSCDVCPHACDVVFSVAEGGKLCSTGYFDPGACRPCTSSSQCESIDGRYPYCITELETLPNRVKAPLACSGDESPGRCAAALACVS